MVNFRHQLSEKNCMIMNKLVTELYQRVKSQIGPVEARDLISDIVNVAISDLEQEKGKFSELELNEAIEARVRDFLEVLIKKPA